MKKRVKLKKIEKNKKGIKECIKVNKSKAKAT